MKYFIITFGCQANKADSERIASVLNNRGWQKTSNKNEADVVVVNACSVRQSAVDRAGAEISRLANELHGKTKHIRKIILAGCLLEKDRQKLKDKVAEIWRPDEYFDFLPIHSDASSAYVPIMTGCDNFCAYCAVPFTRGRERSRPAAQIIGEVKNLIRKGYKEIWLLGQNVNSYRGKFRKEFNFSSLLRAINDIPGKFSIKFLSSHPKDFSDELIKTIGRREKVSKEIHLPVQSGDNEILKKMNRRYTVEHYKNLVKKIRRGIPGAAISTDAIVGFPGETKKQFKNTVRLFKEIKFASAYIARYSPRPGTAAAKLKDNVPAKEKKRRWSELNNLVNESKK